MKKNTLVLIASLVVFIFGLCFAFVRYTGQGSTQNIDMSTKSTTSSSSQEFLNAQRAIEHYRDLIRKKPDEVKNYIQLAQLYLQEGRITGNNAEYIPKAKSLLDEGERYAPNSPEITICRATIEATQHQFDKAKLLAQQAIALNQHSSFYYGVLCDAYVELGDYPNAVATCDKMMSIRPDLRSYARVSYIRELHGDIRGAIQAMTLAADAGISGQENRAWVLYNLGTLFLNENKIDTAEYIYKGILQERPNYAHALRGLARVKSVQGKLDESITLYKQAIAAMSEPAFYEGLGEVYQEKGNTVEAEKALDHAEELYQKEYESGENNRMERAEFLASHNRKLDEALTLAKESIQMRKSVHGYYVLALALFQHSDFAEASNAIQQALRIGTNDASMLYLAGAIANKTGNTTVSKKYLEQALSINPNFSFIHAREAKQMLEKITIGKS